MDLRDVTEDPSGTRASSLSRFCVKYSVYVFQWLEPRDSFLSQILRNCSRVTDRLFNSVVSAASIRMMDSSIAAASLLGIRPVFVGEGVAGVTVVMGTCTVGIPLESPGETLVMGTCTVGIPFRGPVEALARLASAFGGTSEAIGSGEGTDGDPLLGCSAEAR
jgi:hypothetical protein